MATASPGKRPEKPQNASRIADNAPLPTFQKSAMSLACLRRLPFCALLLLCCLPALAAPAAAEASAAPATNAAGDAPADAALPAPADGLSTVAGLTRFMAGYYQHPQPERIGDFLLAAERLSLLDRMKTVFPIFGFLAGVFHDNPGRLSGWTAPIPPDDLKLGGTVLLGLRHAGSKAATFEGEILLVHMPKLAPLAIKHPAVPLEQLPFDHPGILDALWGNFFATGDASPVLRIISALPLMDTPAPKGKAGTPATRDAARKTILARLIGQAARWSLASNAWQHPRVLEICEKAEKAERNPKLKKTLAGIVREVKERQAQGSHATNPAKQP
jgi:hypothetical protein